jgi:hypothetical protein
MDPHAAPASSGRHTLANAMPSMMVRRATWARRGWGAGWQGEAHMLVHLLVDERPMVSTGDKWSSLNNPFTIDATTFSLSNHISLSSEYGAAHYPLTHTVVRIWCGTLPPYPHGRCHPPELATYRCDSAGRHHHHHHDDGWQR